MTVDRSAEVRRLRRRIAELSGRVGEAVPGDATPVLPVSGGAASAEIAGRGATGAEAAGVGTLESDVLAVPGPIAELFASRGMARGSVVSVTGARSLLLSLIATATATGSTVAIVGLPELNLLASAELGADLGRVATVPEPGDDPAQVAGVLLDGIDLVVLGLRGATVAPSRARVLAGRVRRQRAVLLVVDGYWPQVSARISGEVTGHRHLPGRRLAELTAARSGYGRVGGVALRVAVADRGQPERSVDLLLQSAAGGRVEMCAAPVRPATRLAVAN